MEVVWDHKGLIDGFRLYCTRHQGIYKLGEGKELNTILPNKRQLALSDYFFLPGVYYFVITAFNKYGESPPSNEAQVVI